MRQIFIVALGVWIGFATAVLAQADGLDKAKSLFQESVKKQREVVESAFERKITEATRAGDLETIKSLKSDLDAFKQSGDAPETASLKPVSQKYIKAIETARKKLLDAYDKEIKSETKAGHLQAASRMQQEMDALKEGAKAAAPAPAPAAAKTKQNAGMKGDQLFVVNSAIWKQDGRFGIAGQQTQDAKAMLAAALSGGKLFDPNQNTMSLLDGRAVTKSVYIDMVVAGVGFLIQLPENSTMGMRSATVEELNAKGLRIGNSKMELLSVVYQSTDGNVRSNISNTVAPLLLNGGPVIVGRPPFFDVAPGKEKAAVFLFRIGENVLDIKAVEGCQIGLKF